jgi:hypothetical protein
MMNMVPSEDNGRGGGRLKHGISRVTRLNANLLVTIDGTSHA